MSKNSILKKRYKNLDITHTYKNPTLFPSLLMQVWQSWWRMIGVGGAATEDARWRRRSCERETERRKEAAMGLRLRWKEPNLTFWSGYFFPLFPLTLPPITMNLSLLFIFYSTQIHVHTMRFSGLITNISK